MLFLLFFFLFLVFWESGNITATQVTASYMGPFSFIDPQIIINGDVVINNPNYGINLASGYTHISGMIYDNHNNKKKRN